MIYPIMLLGTRTGDIIEVSFSLEYSGISQQKASSKGKSEHES